VENEIKYAVFYSLIKCLVSVLHGISVQNADTENTSHCNMKVCVCVLLLL